MQEGLGVPEMRIDIGKEGKQPRELPGARCDLRPGGVCS